MEGFDLSAGALVAGMLVSTVGMGFFMYGKKEARFPQLIAGMLLMIFPYFADGPTLTYSIGGVLMTLLWFALRAGY